MRWLVQAGTHAPFLAILALQILSMLFLRSKVPGFLKNVICVSIMGTQAYLLFLMIDILRKMP